MRHTKKIIGAVAIVATALVATNIVLKVKDAVEEQVTTEVYEVMDVGYSSVTGESLAIIRRHGYPEVVPLEGNKVDRGMYVEIKIVGDEVILVDVMEDNPNEDVEDNIQER